MRMISAHTERGEGQKSNGLPVLRAICPVLGSDLSLRTRSCVGADGACGDDSGRREVAAIYETPFYPSQRLIFAF